MAKLGYMEGTLGMKAAHAAADNAKREPVSPAIQARLTKAFMDGIIWYQHQLVADLKKGKKDGSKSRPRASTVAFPHRRRR